MPSRLPGTDGSKKKPCISCQIEKTPDLSQVTLCAGQNIPVVSQQRPDVSPDQVQGHEIPEASQEVNEDYVSPEQEEHEKEDVPVNCENCNQTMEGFRFSCVSCSGRAVCGACVVGGAHGACYVLRVPPARAAAEVAAVLRAVRSALAMSLFADELAEPLAGYHYQCQSDVKSETADDDIATDALHDPLAGTSLIFPEETASNHRSSGSKKGTETNFRLSVNNDSDTKCDAQEYQTELEQVIDDVEEESYVMESVADLSEAKSNVLELADASETQSKVAADATNVKLKYLSQVLHADVIKTLRKDTDIKVIDTTEKTEPLQKPGVKRVIPVTRLSENITSKLLIVKKGTHNITSVVNPSQATAVPGPIRITLPPISKTSKKIVPIIIRSANRDAIIPLKMSFPETKTTIKLDETSLSDLSREPGEKGLIHDAINKQPNIVLKRLDPVASGSVTKRKIALDPSTTPQKMKPKTSPS